jgi:hypothetical protein
LFYLLSTFFTFFNHIVRKSVNDDDNTSGKEITVLDQGFIPSASGDCSWRTDFAKHRLGSNSAKRNAIGGLFLKSYLWLEQKKLLTPLLSPTNGFKVRKRVSHWLENLPDDTFVILKRLKKEEENFGRITYRPKVTNSLNTKTKAKPNVLS